MATYSVSPNLEASKVIKSIKIRAPKTSSSSSSSSPSNVKLCNRTVDYFSARLLIQNHANFKLSGTPVRFMFYQIGMWIDFSREIVDNLRSSFLQQTSVIDMVIEGSYYLFDFLHMLQIHLGSGNQRSIAWIDEQGKCFFPKQFIGDEFENNDVENTKIEMRGNSEPKSGKRMREEVKMVQDQEEDKEVTSSYRHGEMSKRQRVKDSKPENPRWPNMKLLIEEDSAYTIVRNVFLPWIRKIHPGAIIATIYQCSGMRPLEKARREFFSKQMEITKAARGTSNTIYAWFGASAQAIAGVLAHGFGVADKLSGSDANAAGVRVSPLANPFRSAMLSETDDNGEKHMILCRVILGNVEKVEAGSQQYHPSSSEFDTGADDPKNPKWYVVWSSNISRHILPECVVSFKTSANKQADLGGFARTKYTFAELFSKIKSSLPPVKVQECMTLYDSLKAGNISKDIFIKRFRLVAGERVLLSAIREICGSE